VLAPFTGPLRRPACQRRNQRKRFAQYVP
jgi:hypothetical protein